MQREEVVLEKIKRPPCMAPMYRVEKSKHGKYGGALRHDAT